jgi:hypothetical protein
MKFHIYDESVMRDGGLLLLSLCHAPENLEPLLQLCQDLCLNALQVHDKTPAVQEAMFSLLSSLPVENREDFMDAQPQALLMSEA